MSQRNVRKRPIASSGRCSVALVEQDQQVDVGLRMQLAAAVAADGDQIGRVEQLFGEVHASSRE